MSSTQDAVTRGLEQAAAITKACSEVGIKDPLEIPALIAYANAAEQFNAAFVTYERATRDYSNFIATHGPEDPGQDYYVGQAAAARDVYLVARQAHAIALATWRAARGLEALRVAAAR